MKVKIPFKSYFKDAMLSGKKTMTSRTKRYGQKGDTFDIFGATFKITNVMQCSLMLVANEYYLDEGCNSSTDFVDVWKQIHPRKGFQSSQMVWVHVFEKEMICPGCSAEIIVEEQRKTPANFVACGNCGIVIYRR